MTENEARQQKAMLLLEYLEAENRLADLKEKAHRVEEALDALRKWLSHARVDFADYREEDKRRDADIRQKLEFHRSALNIDEAVALVDEIAVAHKRLAELAKRKSALGLK